MQLGFFCTFGREKMHELQQIVRKYIKEEDNLSIKVPQFIIIASALNMHEELLQNLIENLNFSLKLRDLLAIFNQLISFAKEFNCINTLKSLIPTLIQAGIVCAIPIKELSLELLSIILYKLPLNSHKLALSKEIISTFANSTVCYNRVSFIHFCLCIKNYCSKKFFCRVFMNSLLSLAHDKTLVVCYKFAQNYIAFRYLVPLANTELIGNFRYILNNYLELNDKILLNYALIADEKMNNNSLWELNYGQKSEYIENQRIKQEQEEETKEQSEIEKLKKIQNEGNAKALRKNPKKLPTSIVTSGRQGSVKPMKKYNLSESDKNDLSLNRTVVRTGLKKK